MNPPLRVGADKSSEAEIANFKFVGLGANQQVFRFDISVHDVLLVEVLNSSKQLEDEEPNAFSAEAIWLFFKDLQQVSVHEFEDQVELSLPARKILVSYEVNLPFERLEHPHDEGVVF